MKQEMVSVIIPCYNCGSTIHEAIHSVFRQSYTNFEIIVVDDGSAEPICNYLKSFSNNVRLIRQQNSGAASARNTGIQHANGNLIAFLDADDIWLPERLELQVAKITDEFYDFVHCPAINFGRLGTWNPQQTEAVDLHPHEYLKTLFLGNFIVTSSVLVKKECLKKAGGFDPKFTNCEDWDLWIRLSRFCKFTCLNKALVKYRIDSSSLSSSPEKVLNAGLAVLEKNKVLLPEQDREKIYKKAVYEMFLNGCWRYLRRRNKRKAAKYALHAIFMNPIESPGWHWLARAILY